MTSTKQGRRLLTCKSATRISCSFFDRIKLILFSAPVASSLVELRCHAGAIQTCKPVLKTGSHSHTSLAFIGISFKLSGRSHDKTSQYFILNNFGGIYLIIRSFKNVAIQCARSHITHFVFSSKTGILSSTAE